MKDIKLGEYTLKTSEGNIDLLFGMRFWRLLSEHGVMIEDLETKLSPDAGIMNIIDTMSKIVYSAGLCYSRKFKTEFNYELDDVLDMFESISQSELEPMMKAMMSTRIFGKDMNQDLPRKAGKQKAPQKKE